MVIYPVNVSYYRTCLRAMLSVMANLHCQLDTPRETESQLKNCLHQINLWFSFLIGSWCRKVQPIEGSTVPRLVGLGCIRKATEHQYRKASV